MEGGRPPGNLLFTPLDKSLKNSGRIFKRITERTLEESPMTSAKKTMQEFQEDSMKKTCEKFLKASRKECMKVNGRNP